MKLAFAHQGVGGILVSSGATYDVAAYGRTHQTGANVALVATLPGWRIHIPGYPDEAEANRVPRSEHRKYGTPAQHNEAHGLDAPSPAGWSRILARKGIALSSDVITYRNHPVPLH